MCLLLCLFAFAVVTHFCVCLIIFIIVCQCIGLLVGLLFSRSFSPRQL